jgi:hypothetical protein
MHKPGFLLVARGFRKSGRSLTRWFQPKVRERLQWVAADG